MLKVVGASWLQTRISTYILVAVILLGLGAIIIGEFGRVENDGTYTAILSWNPIVGYQIDFLGQSNNLSNLPKDIAAKAYYRTKIHKIGWSFVEIETTPSYPDSVQAYAAGFLEGSLTWQLIHHHWSNTINAACLLQEETCKIIRKAFSNDVALKKFRNKIDTLGSKDSYWHMISLFYAQLNGLEDGWRYTVMKSRKNVNIAHSDFIWLALAGDMFNFGTNDTSSRDFTADIGGILIKYLSHDNPDVEPALAIFHHTAAPYNKMLRLLKRYKFGYHVNDDYGAERVPTNSIAMSSYPGALSSQDEYYIISSKKNQDLIVTGRPLRTSNMKKQVDNEIINTLNKNYESHIIMSPARIMAANWLSLDGNDWSKLLARRDDTDISRPIQWAIIRVIDSSIWLVEQHSRTTHISDYTKILNDKKIIYLDGFSRFKKPDNIDISKQSKFKTPELIEPTDELNKKPIKKTKILVNRLKEIAENNNDDTTLKIKQFNKINDTKLNNNSSRHNNFKFRGEFNDVPLPFGVIDTKITIINNAEIKTFTAICGPSKTNEEEPFTWSKTFPKLSHIGHPDKFDFPSVSPKWVFNGD